MILPALNHTKKLMETDRSKQKTSEYIKIDRPAKYGVIIEDAGGDSISPFKQIYMNAKDNVKSIIIANDKTFRNGSNYVKTEGTINTTIAFIGGRGMGKSSAMTSFSRYLSISGTADFEKEGCGTCRFYSTPVIDANQLGKNETILGRISAALITEYNLKKKDLLTDERREFVGLAKRVNNLAVKYTSGEWFKASDTIVSETLNISQLRDDIKKLIRKFLKIQTGNAENSYLVVSIDDIDMGIENSYSIMEEIRKFLCIPNVIVLISLDIRQLELILKTNYYKLLGKDNLDDYDTITVKSLSFRYIEKLFPYGRQHHMPELSLIRLKAFGTDGFFNDGSSEYISDEETWKKWKMSTQWSSAFYAIMHLIWRKTMLIPVCNSDGDYLLIPRNFRSLYNMVVFLRDLPDAISPDENMPPKSDEQVQIISNNLDSFRSYLIDNLEMVDVHEMNKDDREMVKILTNLVLEFPEMTLLTMNSKIVADILQSLKVTNKENVYRKVLFEKDAKAAKSAKSLIDASVYPDSISVGDLMYVIGKIDAKTTCRYIKYLIEVIRTLWSIKMTKEFYNNCRHKISHEFRRGIGGLIVNPDCTEFFHVVGRGDDLKKSWFTFDKPKNSVAFNDNVIKSTYKNDEIRYDTFIKHISSSMTVWIDENGVPDRSLWRLMRHKGMPYFEYFSKDSDLKNAFIHPFSIFSHIIAEQELNQASMPIYGYKSLADAVRKKFAEDNLTNMPIPLYSLDFLYRWYETVKRYMQSVPQNDYFSCFCQLFNIKKVFTESLDTSEFFAESLKYYMPIDFVENVIVKPLNIIHDYLSEITTGTKNKGQSTGSNPIEQNI